MMHFLLSSIVLALTVLGFNRGYSLSGINAAYLGLYKGLVEECVAVLDAGGEYLNSPLIYTPKLDRMLEEYYELNLAPYCRDYSYGYRSLDRRISVEGASYCHGVEITFTAIVDDLLTLSKKAEFHIERTDRI